ncbi:MAG: BON domain-containing protein [Burkholderia gladioli]
MRNGKPGWRRLHRGGCAVVLLACALGREHDATAQPDVGGRAGNTLAPTVPHWREVDDAALSARLKLAYAGSGAFSSSDIHVTTRQGEVSLSGTVPDTRRRELAGAAARRARGVRAVHNALVVRDP